MFHSKGILQDNCSPSIIIISLIELDSILVTMSSTIFFALLPVFSCFNYPTFVLCLQDNCSPMIFITTLQRTLCVFLFEGLLPFIFFFFWSLTYFRLLNYPTLSCVSHIYHLRLSLRCSTRLWKIINL